LSLNPFQQQVNVQKERGRGIPGVKKLSLNFRAADVLRDQIVSGRLKAGTRFTEVSIAEEMDLSRGTIRSALQLLASEGLVTQTPYTAWEVTTLQPHDVWELYTLRAALEGLATRLAAEKIDTEGERKLDRAADRLIRACRGGDALEVGDADFELHKTIISLSKHQRLERQYRMVEHQIRLCILSSNELVPNLEAIILSHAPIVAAIKARNPDLAERLSKEYNQKHAESLLEHFSSSATEKGASKARA